MICLLSAWLLLAGGAKPLPAQAAQASHLAALLVDLGDGRLIARVVSFDEETISGADLLLRSGLDVAMTAGLGGGTAVCAIEQVGCPPTPQDCWCQCRGADCRYWNYFNLERGSWVYAGLGASDRRLGEGDVDGWVWGDGSTPPPLLTWEEILALAQPAEPTPPPPPTATADPAEPTTTPPVPTSLPTTPPAKATATTLPEATARAEPTANPTATTPPSVPTAKATPTPVTTVAPAETGPLEAPPLQETAAVETDQETQGVSPAALAFAGLVLLLGVMWLWARRRR